MRPRYNAVLSSDLAIQLGAIWPHTMAHHKELIEQSKLPPGCIVVRDRATGWPLFWKLLDGVLEKSS